MQLSLSETDHKTVYYALARLVEMALHGAIHAKTGRIDWESVKDGMTALEKMNGALEFPDDEPIEDDENK